MNHSDDDQRKGEPAPWLRRELIAPWWGIVIVVCLIIGHSSLASTWQFLHGTSQNYLSYLATNQQMIRVIALESSILGLFFIYLNRRGWETSDFRIKPSLVSSGQALLLIVAMALANSMVVSGSYLILYATQTHYHSFYSYLIAIKPDVPPQSIDFSWFAIIPAMVLNAFFEELTCMGYAFCQFAGKKGPIFALVLTVLLRTSCHTYQGIVHALGIGMAFFVAGLFYWRTRNLWPLILAHIVVDTASMGLLKHLLR